MYKFWGYFEKTWLPIVKSWNIRDEFDEYIKVLARTNNGLEQYNKRLNSLYNTNRVSILNFIETLKKESIYQVEKLNNIRNGVQDRQEEYYLDTAYDDINMNLYVDWMIRQQDELGNNNSNEVN